MITPEVKSPVVIKDLSNEIDSYNYSVTTESTSYFSSLDSKYVVPTTGKTADNDGFSSTDYISCSGYTYLLLSAPTAQIGAFYDANKKYGWIIFDGTPPSNVSYAELQRIMALVLCFSTIGNIPFQQRLHMSS